jgi:hypothetical protein
LGSLVDRIQQTDAASSLLFDRRRNIRTSPVLELAIEKKIRKVVSTYGIVHLKSKLDCFVK